MARLHKFQVGVNTEILVKLKKIAKEEERSLSQTAARIIRLGLETKERIEAEERVTR